MPEGVALPPGLGAEVPPFGVVVAVLVDWVGVVATVDCVVVAIGSMGAVVLELLFELSPTTMIRPTTSPITTATSPLGPHPCRRRSDIVHPVSLDGVPLFVQSGCLTTPTARRL